MTSSDDPERWRRLEEAFAHALALDPTARAEWLARTLADEDRLRREVVALLEANEASERLEPPAVDLRDPLLSRRIGGCRLLRVIGAGGMGAVYEAEQENPRRTVAVKVMREGFEGDELRRRFELEAQILGSLRDPGIAQIYEAGTDEGPNGERVPYFVMELVPDARPITLYAEEKRLSVHARIETMARVCRAVHAGHVKGVIHRDLKPANVLVDADGNVKVIDFGIARATDPKMRQGTAPTEAGLLVGTLPYMSPEQIEATSDALDLRSDVYALGVLLYELLCGRLPHRLETLPLAEAARVILTEPPDRPRDVKPGLDRDVETIVLKCLSKLREQRYPSADELARDLERYLRHEPIQARPPSLAYHLRLFARRNRAAFGGALGGLLALIGAVVVSTLFAVREARERARAEALLAKSRELPQWMVSRFDAELGRLPRSARARELLYRKVQEYVTGLALTERDDPTLRSEMATVYVTLGEVLAADDRQSGDTRGALEAITRGIEEFERLLPAREGDLDALVRLGNAYLSRGAVRRSTGDLDGAAEDFSRARSTLVRLAEPDRRRGRGGAAWSRLHRMAGDLASSRGAWDEAAREYAAARDVLEALRAEDPDDLDVLQSMVLVEWSEGVVRHALGEGEEGQARLDAAARYEARLAELGFDPTRWTGAWFHQKDLGDLLLARGDVDGALARYGKALAAAEAASRQDPDDAGAAQRLFVSHSRVANARMAQRDFVAAKDALEAARAVAARLVEADPANVTLRRDLSGTDVDLARARMMAGDSAGAEAALAAGLGAATRLVEEVGTEYDRERLAKAQAQRALLELHGAGQTADAVAARVRLEAALASIREALEGYRALEARGALSEDGRTDLGRYAQVEELVRLEIARLEGR
jgi:tetratricopeptide (TPR) repeat protein